MLPLFSFRDKLISVEARDKRTWNTVIRILFYNEGVQVSGEGMGYTDWEKWGYVQRH